MDHDVFFRCLNGNIQTLFGLSIQNEFGSDFILLVLHLDLIHIRLPEIVMFQGAVQLVRDVLQRWRHVLVIDIHSVFQHVADLLQEILLGQGRAPTFVLFALLFLGVLFVFALFAFPLHLLTAAFGLRGDLDVVAFVTSATPAQFGVSQDFLLFDFVHEVRLFGVHHLGVEASLEGVRVQTVHLHVDLAVTLAQIDQVLVFHIDLGLATGLEFDLDLGFVTVLHFVLAILLEGILAGASGLGLRDGASVRVLFLGRGLFGGDLFAGRIRIVDIVERGLTTQNVERWAMDFLAVHFLGFSVDFDLDILIGFARLRGQDQFVLAGEQRVRGAGRAALDAALEAGAQAHIQAQRLTTVAFVECRNAVQFLSSDRLLIGVALVHDVVDVVLPRSGVGDRAALDDQEIAFLGRRFNDGTDLRRRSQFDFQFQIDRREHLGLGLDLDTGDRNRGPCLDATHERGHGARFQFGLDLDRFRGHRFQVGLDLTLQTEGHRGLDGDGERESESGGHLQMHIVQLSDGGEVHWQSTLEFWQEFADFGGEFADQLLHPFFAHGQEPHGLGFEHGREVGFRFVLVLVVVLTVFDLEVFGEDVVQLLFVFVVFLSFVALAADAARVATLQQIAQRVGVHGRIGFGHGFEEREQAAFVVEFTDQRFQTFVEQRQRGQVFVPIAQTVGVQLDAHVTGDGRDVGVDGAEVHTQTVFEQGALEGGVRQFAVAPTGGDAFRLTQG